MNDSGTGYYESMVMPLSPMMDYPVCDTFALCDIEKNMRIQFTLLWRLVLALGFAIC